MEGYTPFQHPGAGGVPEIVKTYPYALAVPHLGTLQTSPPLCRRPCRFPGRDGSRRINRVRASYQGIARSPVTLGGEYEMLRLPCGK
jgi:hypothetical protein